MDKKILCSVCVISYNQERFIQQTLDSILSQKTDFRFELLISDDASTDNTQKIIKEYELQYPNIIRNISRSKNVGSQKNFYSTMEEAKGKYIALCEGDDYWISIDKLQNQYDALEKNEDIDICFTNSLRMFPNNNLKKNNRHGSESKIFNLSQVVRGGGGFMPTASLFLRKRVFDRLPEWYSSAPVGDYYLQVIASSQNGALYLPTVSCVYRVSAKGSWTLSRRKISNIKILSNLDKSLRAIEGLIEFGVGQEDLNYAKANIYCHTAHVLLINKYYKESRSAIVSSWRFTPRLSMLQKFIYFFRFLLPIAKIAFKLK